MNSPEDQESLTKSEAAKPNAKYRENSLRFRRFTEEYLKTGTAYQAALAAGYSRATAESDTYKLARCFSFAMLSPFSMFAVGSPEFPRWYRVKITPKPSLSLSCFFLQLL